MDGSAHFNANGYRGPGSRWLGRIVAGVAFLLVAGCLHLILSVTADQDALARGGRWLEEATAFKRLLEDLADEAENLRDMDGQAFHAQIPGVIKQEVADGGLLASVPLDDGGTAVMPWREGILPLETALTWLGTDEGTSPEIVAEPAHQLAASVALVLPRVRAGLTTRSEQLDGERSWLLAVAGLIALGGVLLAVAYLRLRGSRDALALAANALSENDERYRSMFEQNHAIQLLIASESGRIVEANRAACLFYGGCEDDLRALRMPDIIESPKRALHELQAMATDRRQTTLLMRHRVLDGRVRDVEMHLSPITVRGNELLYAVLHDVTDRLALEKEMRRAEQLESLGVLAGGIAHDFNNFLASMIGNLQLAQLDVEPGSTVAEALTGADGACRRAQELARQLLTFTKGGAPVRQPTCLADLLRQTARFALRGAPTAHEIDVERDLRAANVDEGQISQVLHNLVINANQAMPSGGTVRITARNREVVAGNALALAPGPYVHIAVTDEGIGIPQDDLDRIFQPYFTTKKGGSGLGLATSYSIVRKHEGTLTVESVVGRGTTFHVHLPAATAAPAAAPVRPSVDSTGGERILWLEDDPAIASVVERMLARYGYAVEVYDDGTAICARYAEAQETGEPFDLVVLDLTIPGGMGGAEAAQRLRALDPRVRAVACSGYQDDEIFGDLAGNGFCAALRKPFTRESLAAVLIDAFEGDQRASEAA